MKHIEDRYTYIKSILRKAHPKSYENQAFLNLCSRVYIVLYGIVTIYGLRDLGLNLHILLKSLMSHDYDVINSYFFEAV